MDKQCFQGIPGCEDEKKALNFCFTFTPQQYINTLDSDKTNKQRNISRAAFIKSNLWQNPIKIAFSPNSIAISESGVYTMENGGLTSDADPISVEIAKGWASATDKVKYQNEAFTRIITERYGPIMKPGFLNFNSKGGNPDLTVFFDNSGGSYTNDLGNKATEIHFGWFDGATMLHEFGHAMGMIHEHDNPIGPDGKSKIRLDINEDKLVQFFQCTQGWDAENVKAQVLTQYDTTTLNGSVFDIESIMLYPIPDCLTNNRQGTHRNQRLSANDMVWIDKNYGGKSTHTTANGVYTLTSSTPQEAFNNAYANPSVPGLKKQTFAENAAISAAAAAGFGLGGSLPPSPSPPVVPTGKKKPDPPVDPNTDTGGTTDPDTDTGGTTGTGSSYTSDDAKKSMNWLYLLAWFIFLIGFLSFLYWIYLNLKDMSLCTKKLKSCNKKLRSYR